MSVEKHKPADGETAYVLAEDYENLYKAFLRLERELERQKSGKERMLRIPSTRIAADRLLEAQEYLDNDTINGRPTTRERLLEIQEILLTLDSVIPKLLAMATGDTFILASEEST